MENKIVVAIRVDSSIKIGSGHVMRCLTLAEQVKSLGKNVFFICSESPGNMADLIDKKGYAVFTFPFQEAEQSDCWKRDVKHTKKILSKLNNQVDWLIVDHYGLDVKWETPMRDFARKIMVIDDLANRQHDCDVLLDQNFYLDLDRRYTGLVPKYCKQLLGPQYILLRPEFYKARKNLRNRDGIVRRIFVFFGGSDHTNDTAKALEAIRNLNRSDIAVDVVVGTANQNKEGIKESCTKIPNIKFHCQVDNMAELMANADLAIGAGGTATWERCFLGLPALAIIVADNQIKVTEAVAIAGAIQNLGMSMDVAVKDLVTAITNALDNPLLLKSMINKAMRLMENEDDNNYSYIRQIF